MLPFLLRSYGTIMIAAGEASPAPQANAVEHGLKAVPAVREVLML